MNTKYAYFHLLQSSFEFANINQSKNKGNYCVLMHQKSSLNALGSYCAKWKWLHTLKCKDIHYCGLYVVLSLTFPRRISNLLFFGMHEKIYDRIPWMHHCRHFVFAAFMRNMGSNAHKSWRQIIFYWRQQFGFNRSDYRISPICKSDLYHNLIISIRLI